MIKNDLLHSFLLVANTGSITKAAEAKFLTAMAMSKQMANLETQLGQPLFERSGRSLRLTEFGKQFKQEAAKVMTANQAMENWLVQRTGEVQGTVKVVAQSVDMLKQTVIPWLAEFCELYPQIKVELDVNESILNINDDEFDIFWGVSDYLGDKYPNLKRKKLWQSAYGIYASPGYIEQYGSPLNLDDIEQHYIVGYLHNQPSNVLVVQDQQLDYKLLKQKVATVTGLVELASDGLGLINAACDLKEITDAIEQNKLQPVLQEYWWQQAEVFAYYHNVRHLQPKVSKFIEFFVSKKDGWL